MRSTILALQHFLSDMKNKWSRNISSSQVPQFALDGIFNEISWVKTIKLMNEGGFDNLMGERILKKTLPLGESLPKISAYSKTPNTE